VIGLIHVINSNQGLDWAAKGIGRILQNVVNLINTHTYEVGYMRAMGLTRKYLDHPVNVIEGIATAEIIDLVRNFEPRARVLSVTIRDMADDNVNFEVVVDV
jgi:phage baseplate assembly protein W